MPNREDEFRELASTVISSDKQAYKRAVVITILSLILGGVWIAFAFRQVRTLESQSADLEKTVKAKTTKIDELDEQRRVTEKQLDVINDIFGIPPDELAKLQEFGWLKDRLACAPKEKGLVAESLKAEAQLKSAGPNSGGGKTFTVEYFSKEADQGKVEAALKDLGFDLQKDPPQGGTATNAIWIGNQVNLEAAKLVAYTLLRAGIQIRYIGRHRRDPNLIQVGGRPQSRNDPPWTVDRLRSATMEDFAN